MKVSPCLLAASSSAPLRGIGRGGQTYKEGVIGREQVEAKDLVNKDNPFLRSCGGKFGLKLGKTVGRNVFSKPTFHIYGRERALGRR